MFLNYHLFSLSLSRWVSRGHVFISTRFHATCQRGTCPFGNPWKLLTLSSGGFHQQRSIWRHSLRKQRQRQLPHPDRESSGLRHHQSHAAIARCRRGLSETLRGQSTGDIPRGATLTAWRDRQRGCSSRPPSVWAQLRQRQIHTLQ